MGLRDRISRLEGEQRCEECPFPQPIQTFRSNKIVYPDGSVDLQLDPRLRDREPSPEPCSECPYGPGGLKPPIRTIHVIGTVQAGED